MSKDFTTLLPLLARLKERDSEFTTFGSSHHKFETLSPANESDIDAFEDLYSCQLPKEYRSYLTKVGNGRVGPFYGISGLEDHTYLDSPELAPNLATPFPYTEAWNEGPAYFEEWEGYEEDNEEEIEAKEQDYWGPHRVPGALEICDYGCNLRFLLIVSGPEKGNIWFDRRVDWEGLHPIRPTIGAAKNWFQDSGAGPERLGLYDWFEGWLTHSLAELD